MLSLLLSEAIALTCVFVPASAYNETYAESEEALVSEVMEEKDGDSDFVTEGTVLTQYSGSSSNIVIPEGITEIAENAFSKNTDLYSVTMPSTLKKIGKEAFYSCTRLSKVTFNDGLEEIGESAFNSAIGIRSLTIPGSVKTIGKRAFNNLRYLTSLTLEEGIETIGDYAFEVGCLKYNPPKLKSVVIPDSVKYIGNGAFYWQLSLEEVVIGKNVETIGDWAFCGCQSLKSIEIPDSVTSMGKVVFGEDLINFICCDALTAVKLGKGLESIPMYAFDSCKALESVTISNSVTSIGEYSFRSCGSLKNIYFTGTQSEWDSISKENANIPEDCTVNCTEEAYDPIGSLDGAETSVGKLRVYGWAYDPDDTDESLKVDIYIGGKADSDTVVHKISGVTADKPQEFFGSASGVSGEHAFDVTLDTDIEGNYPVYAYAANIGKGSGDALIGCIENVEFKKPSDIGKCTVSAVPDQEYTGKAVTPSLTVKDGAKALTDGTDYTVSYSDNIKAGTATVTITGKGSYAGTLTASFNILKTYPTLKAAGGDKSVTLTWSAVDGAAKYGVYKYANNKYTKIDLNVTDTTYTVTGLADNTEYTFFVQAYKNKWLAGADESYASAKTYSGIKYPVVKAEGGDKQITLTWSAVDGATKYGVYKFANNKYTKISTEVTGTTYTVTGLADNTEYTFFVQAYAEKWLAGGDESYAAAKTNGALTYPVVKAEGGDKQITLTWSAVDGATKYGVYKFANNKYTKINLNVTDTAYTVTGLADNTEYTFFVQAYAEKWLAGSDESYAAAKTNGALTYPVVKAEGGDRQITLTWSAVAGATKYGVYKVVNGKYTKLDLNVTGTTYTVNGLAEGTEYTFFVQAYTTKWLAGSDESCATARTNGALTYPAVKATAGTNSVTLTWSEVSGVTKYGVYRYANGKYTKLDLNVTGTTYTVNGLAANTEYTFFVQAYTTKWLAGGNESYATVSTN